MWKTEDFLPYEVGYLPPELQKVAEVELHETEENRNRCLEELRALLENEKNLYSRTDDNFLLPFLRTKKYNVQKAFKNIQDYFRFSAEKSYIYNSESNAVVHEVFRKNFIGFLPRRDKEGSVVLVWRIGLWAPAEVSVDLLMWTITHCLVHSIEDPATQVAGYTVLLDVNGIGLENVRMWTPTNILLLLHSTQCCFPGRFRGIHVIGGPKIISICYSIVFPFLGSKLRKTIFFHGDDLKSLHEAIPPCILPSEFGGDTGPFSNKQWHDLILSRNDWILSQRLYGYNKQRI